MKCYNLFPYNSKTLVFRAVLNEEAWNRFISTFQLTPVHLYVHNERSRLHSLHGGAVSSSFPFTKEREEVSDSEFEADTVCGEAQLFCLRLSL